VLQVRGSMLSLLGSFFFLDCLPTEKNLPVRLAYVYQFRFKLRAGSRSCGSNRTRKKD
jgi:hypothetical protein